MDPKPKGQGAILNKRIKDTLSASGYSPYTELVPTNNDYPLQYVLKGEVVTMTARHEPHYVAGRGPLYENHFLHLSALTEHRRPYDGEVVELFYPPWGRSTAPYLNFKYKLPSDVGLYWQGMSQWYESQAPNHNMRGTCRLEQHSQFGADFAIGTKYLANAAFEVSGVVTELFNRQSSFCWCPRRRPFTTKCLRQAHFELGLIDEVCLACFRSPSFINCHDASAATSMKQLERVALAILPITIRGAVAGLTENAVLPEHMSAVSLNATIGTVCSNRRILNILVTSVASKSASNVELFLENMIRHFNSRRSDKFQGARDENGNPIGLELIPGLSDKNTWLSTRRNRHCRVGVNTADRNLGTACFELRLRMCRVRPMTVGEVLTLIGVICSGVLDSGTLVPDKLTEKRRQLYPELKYAFDESLATIWVDKVVACTDYGRNELLQMYLKYYPLQ